MLKISEGFLGFHSTLHGLDAQNLHPKISEPNLIIYPRSYLSQTNYPININLFQFSSTMKSNVKFFFLTFPNLNPKQHKPKKNEKLFFFHSFIFFQQERHYTYMIARKKERCV